MSISAIFSFIFGLAIITIGAEVLLKGASKIAYLLKIKPIVIGLTVVSIGTSLPELAVGLTAVHSDSGDIAVGNIAGTNIVNILFILGLSAAIRPLSLHLKSIKTEIYTMIAAAVVLLILSLDGKLYHIDGILLLALGVAYLYLIVKSSKTETEEVQHNYELTLQHTQPSPILLQWFWNAFLLIAGIVATIYGADFLVSGAVEMARYFGMSDAVIGLTIIAIGTSAPELATTLVATFKNQRDVAVGNLLGSSIINIFIILGITVIATPGGIDVSKDLLWFDLPLAALVAIVCYPVFKSDQMVSRREGIVFVSLYITYLLFLLFYRT